MEEDFPRVTIRANSELIQANFAEIESRITANLAEIASGINDKVRSMMAIDSLKALDTGRHSSAAEAELRNRAADKMLNLAKNYGGGLSTIQKQIMTTSQIGPWVKSPPIGVPEPWVTLAVTFVEPTKTFREISAEALLKLADRPENDLSEEQRQALEAAVRFLHPSDDYTVKLSHDNKNMVIVTLLEQIWNPSDPEVVRISSPILGRNQVFVRSEITPFAKSRASVEDPLPENISVKSIRHFERFYIIGHDETVTFRLKNKAKWLTYWEPKTQAEEYEEAMKQYAQDDVDLSFAVMKDQHKDRLSRERKHQVPAYIKQDKVQFNKPYSKGQRNEKEWVAWLKHNPISTDPDPKFLTSED